MCDTPQKGHVSKITSYFSPSSNPTITPLKTRTRSAKLRSPSPFKLPQIQNNNHILRESLPWGNCWAPLHNPRWSQDLPVWKVWNTRTEAQWEFQNPREQTTRSPGPTEVPFQEPYWPNYWEAEVNWPTTRNPEGRPRSPEERNKRKQKNNK